MAPHQNRSLRVALHNSKRTNDNLRRRVRELEREKAELATLDSCVGRQWAQLERDVHTLLGRVDPVVAPALRTELHKALAAAAAADSEAVAAAAAELSSGAAAGAGSAAAAAAADGTEVTAAGGVSSKDLSVPQLTSPEASFTSAFFSALRLFVCFVRLLLLLLLLL